jgi:hypothetical protein
MDGYRYILLIFEMSQRMFYQEGTVLGIHQNCCRIFWRWGFGGGWCVNLREIVAFSNILDFLL